MFVAADIIFKLISFALNFAAFHSFKKFQANILLQVNFSEQKKDSEKVAVEQVDEEMMICISNN